MFLFTACGTDKNKVRIVGEFEKLNNAEFLLLSESNNWGEMDTVRVKDGEFDVLRPLKKPTIVTILYPNFYEQYFIAVPGKKITIKGHANNLRETKIEGSDENHELTNFRLHTLNKSADDQRMAAADYIEQHPKSIVSEVLFRQFFLEVATFEDDQTIPLLQLLIDNQPDNIDLQVLLFRLKAMNQLKKGKILPTTQFITLSKDTIKVEDLKGKPLIISFWATWHSKSLKSISDLSEIRTAYRDKINLLSISLDVDSAFCHKKIVRDSIPGYCVCDGKGWDSPYVRDLGLRYIPGNILVDKDGKIIGRDFTWKELQNNIDKLLN